MIYEYLDKIPRQITQIYLDTLLKSKNLDTLLNLDTRLKSKNIDRTSQLNKTTIKRIGETARKLDLGQFRK